ncbi:MAG: SusC/RagA family protein, partial [Duncaniella sp.]|nr:SusC/RagA family protein [Duncaniella sp.]
TLPGKMKFKDLNGDGVIDENDRKVIGRTTPKIQGGFGINGQWKQFDFAANFTYFLDFDVYNATAYHLSSATGGDQDYFNVLSRFNDRWKYAEGSECLHGNYWLNSWPQEQINAYYEAYNVGCTTWNPADVNKEVTMSYFVEDGSFLRCNDITVGYSLPTNIIKHAGMSKCRFYASVANPFIITNYSGYDPEVDIQSGLTPSYDYNRYPRSRSYVFGINLTF